MTTRVTHDGEPRAAIRDGVVVRLPERQRPALPWPLPVRETDDPTLVSPARVFDGDEE